MKIALTAHPLHRAAAMTQLEQARADILAVHAMLQTNRVSALRAAHVNFILERLSNAHQAITRHEEREAKNRRIRRAARD